ncbi:MAG: hypothetical protein ACF8MF_01460 [Phycisphaerales bacterium JB052]
MGPLGLIRAMLEPCETRGQAWLTSGCMFLLGIGIGAVCYACVLYTLISHGALTELYEMTPEYKPSLSNRSNIYMMIGAGYTLTIVTGVLTLLMLLGSVMVLIRAQLPQPRGE